MTHSNESPRIQEVPRDHILDVPDAPAVEFAHAEALFRQLHEMSEKEYNGDGTWSHGCADPGVFNNVDTPCSKPLIRHTAWPVQAYIQASEILWDKIFEERARSGARHLLREQRADGYFPYYLDDSGWPKRDAAGIMYVTGVGAGAMVDAYTAYKDPEFLHSAYRASEWAIRFPSVENTNYNSFCVMALARTAEALATAPQDHFPRKSFVEASLAVRRPGEDLGTDCIEGAVSLTQRGVFPNQQVNGGWPGHNSWVWYHGIILRGHAHLLRVLPDDHPSRLEVRGSAVAAINYLIINLTPDGNLYANHESNEIGIPHLAFEAVRAIQPEDVGGAESIQRLLRLLASAVIRNVAETPNMVFNAERQRTVKNLADAIKAVSYVLEYLRRSM